MALCWAIIQFRKATEKNLTSLFRKNLWNPRKPLKAGNPQPSNAIRPFKSQQAMFQRNIACFFIPLLYLQYQQRLVMHKI
jgi:hypothetical protein